VSSQFLIFKTQFYRKPLSSLNPDILSCFVWSNRRRKNLTFIWWLKVNKWENARDFDAVHLQRVSSKVPQTAWLINPVSTWALYIYIFIYIYIATSYIYIYIYIRSFLVNVEDTSGVAACQSPGSPAHQHVIYSTPNGTKRSWMSIMLYIITHVSWGNTSSEN